MARTTRTSKAEGVRRHSGVPVAERVPASRIRPINDAPVRREGDFVLYWMTAFRRAGWNFALQRAVEWCRELGRPLLVLEALRSGYRWKCDRFHRFVLEGMAENAAAFERAGVTYYPYVEPALDEGKGLLAALADRACVVVADDFPDFFLPRMVAAAGRKLPIRLEAIDSNGLLPLRVAGKPYGQARAFRLLLQKTLRQHLELPKANPLARANLPRSRPVPRAIASRWRPASARLLAGGSLATLPIDHSIAPVSEQPGGTAAARARLRLFIDQQLERYAVDHNHPDAEATSGLSAYLHFGHLSSHEVIAALAEREGWSVDRLPTRTSGGARGWWGMSESAEAFLDQLVTWRELGYNFCAFREDYERYGSLPTWARLTLAEHTADPRPVVYGLDELEGARTGDELWNAAQRQLVREGRIHNYLRILWGKRILEWSPTPERALETMVELNNKYALDGRDPNSYSGIFWILGRYDRPWGPQRPVFGKVRYMSSSATLKKVRVRGYLARYGPESSG